MSIESDEALLQQGATTRHSTATSRRSNAVWRRCSVARRPWDFGHTTLAALRELGEGGDAPARIGVFGGTFDPPHVGHVRVAADVAAGLELDRVLWIPARVSPFKLDEKATAAELRLEMVREAAAADPRFQVDDRELDRPGPSYTVDTLEEIRSEHPDAELFLILGADQFAEFPRWREPERIVRVARLAVMNRAGTSPRSMVDEVAARVPGLEDAVVFVPVTDIEISSTQVRATVARGGDASGAVPAGVLRVIRSRGLYEV